MRRTFSGSNLELLNGDLISLGMKRAEKCTDPQKPALVFYLQICYGVLSGHNPTGGICVHMFYEFCGTDPRLEKDRSNQKSVECIIFRIRYNASKDLVINPLAHRGSLQELAPRSGRKLDGPVLISALARLVKET